MNALTHRSYANEQGISNNERLEFLGDAVLQLVVTRHLFSDYPHLQEGQMTRVRAAVVQREALVGVAEALGVGPALRLGKGEVQSGGSEKVGILADATEALIGAVYVDGGWKAAERLVMRCWQEMIAQRAAAPDARDAKTELQERLASVDKDIEYRMKGEGPGHARRFRVEVFIGGERRGFGEGSSRRSAEQLAAAQALRDLFPDEQVSFLHPADGAPPSGISGAPAILGRLRRLRHRRSGRKT